MQTLRRVAATVAVGAIVMAGCGGSDDDAADDAGTADAVTTVPPSEPAEEADAGEETSAGDVDACAIVALLDVETLMGEPGAPIDDTSDLGASCQVAPVNEESDAGLRLTVETQHGPENYAQQKELLGVDTEVSGLGDEAFHTGPYLFVLRGDTLAFLQVLQSVENGFAAEDADLEAAMAIVLAELG
ncbi:MAG TPA: hypothetical protein VFY82_06465 [Acidimicrobiales bacterium]|nr:hypothetical protein [Acidimicrobiales bacterium]